jgi:hypothetical protein
MNGKIRLEYLSDFPDLSKIAAMVAGAPGLS